jgi:hypothetical protein
MVASWLTSLPPFKLFFLAASAVASLWVAQLVWRRGDPLLFKCTVLVLGFLPVLGPLIALWICSFPDKMHPDMQAKYKRTVNSYSVPKAAIEASVKKGRRDDSI